jgi:hypothetical protein
MADVSVRVVPRPPTLSQKDFEVLRLEIEKNDIPLEVIQAFRTSDNSIR